MKYFEVIPISREEAKSAILSDNPDIICNALLRLTYHDPDWQWVQNLCLQLVQYEDTNIRGLAVTCLGHLACIHGVLNTEKVVPILEDLRHDPDVGGKVEDALDDIQMFIHEET